MDSGVSTGAEEPLVQTLEQNSQSGRGRPQVLYLYSGPHRPNDGLARYLRDMGADCVCVDREFNESHVLLDQTFWEMCKADFDKYDSWMSSPPCSSFTPARRGQGGPEPLRGVQGPERYGLRNLRPEDKKKVVEGNVLAIRASEASGYAHCHGRWWIVEQPHGRPGKTSMWTLDEFVYLMELEDVYKYTFDQCRVGCRAQKKTDFISNIPGLDEFTVTCDHQPTMWVIPWSGERIYAPHPPLKGRQWAILEEEWDPSMLRDNEPPGEYITRSCAAYPAELNKALAKALCRRRKQDVEPVPQEQEMGDSHDDKVKVQKLMPLRGHHDEKPGDQPRNSLRDVHKWVTDKARYIGVQVRNIITRQFDRHPQIESDILESLGHKSNEEILDVEWMTELRKQVMDLLSRNRRHGMPEECSLDEIDEDGYKTCIRGRLLEYWAQVVDDPGKTCASWTYKGAPAGLEIPTDDLDGVFPSAQEEDQEVPWEALTTDFANFQNYTGVEDDDDAFATLEGYHMKGYLSKHSSLELRPPRQVETLVMLNN